MEQNVIDKSAEILSQANAVFDTDFKEAFRLANESLLLAEKSDNKEIKADSLYRLARCYIRFSDYPHVLEKTLEAMTIYRETGDVKGEASCLDTLGWVYNYLGDHESRLKSNLHCLDLRKEIGDVAGEINTMNNVGDTYIQLGIYDKALEYFNACLAHPELTEKSKSVVFHNIGEVYFYKKDFKNAREYFSKGFQQAQKTDYFSISVIANVFLAEINIEEGTPDEAKSCLEIALRISEENDITEDIYRIHKNLSVIYEIKGLNDLAFRHYKLFHEASENLFNQNKIQQIKNIQFEYESDLLKRETERERGRNLKLSRAYEQIEFQKKDITDSITYAKRLQDAMLPSIELLKTFLPESFVFYKPKDIVSGDFYWFERWGNKLFVGAVDCTGHGVPGAFMSIVGHNLLREALHERGLSRPSLILNDLNKSLVKLLNHSDSKKEMVTDGMDATIAAINLKEKKIEVASAYNPLFLIRNKKLHVIEADRFSVGAQVAEEAKLFTHREVQLESGDCIYFFTDGFADQFGGPLGKKFKYSRLKEKLIEISDKQMDEQMKLIDDTFENWRGDLEQVDDVLIMGIRIS
ncbi:hypothetical protein BH09BAC5_BH09BAC5_21830 [soil metagenome]